MGIIETGAYLAGGMAALIFPIVLIAQVGMSLSRKPKKQDSSENVGWLPVCGLGVVATVWYLYFHAGACDDWSKLGFESQSHCEDDYSPFQMGPNDYYSLLTDTTDMTETV